MRCVGKAFREFDVRAIYLIHGTFVGTDAFGMIREVARFSENVAQSLRRWEKQFSDSLIGEAGNFTVSYAQEFERALGEYAGKRIPVRLFTWSSENHHIGRADGAVHLIHELATNTQLAGGRVLLWGHSHGGNLLSLVTNLLANPWETNRQFFRACRPYYFRWPGGRKDSSAVWNAVRHLLLRGDSSLTQQTLDLVTLGTPVRYGWDDDACAHLLHFINHRPQKGVLEHLAAIPASIDEVLMAVGGDYIQQLGIAGSNLTPPLWAIRTWLAELRVGRILQSGLPRADLLTRLKLGVRVHDTGDNLLVDYGDPEGHVGQHLAGHAVYTRTEWLLFHAEEVASRFYAAEATARDSMKETKP